MNKTLAELPQMTARNWRVKKRVISGGIDSKKGVVSGWTDTMQGKG